MIEPASEGSSKLLVGGEIKAPVLVIVGPTASGKTKLAIETAQKYNGEIISADSRAIYKYVDIASAKPTQKEQSGIKHWGLDIVEPEDFAAIEHQLSAPFTVADFKKYAEKKIQDVQSRGKLAIVVGGTGLYIDALIYDYQFAGRGVTTKTQPKDQRAQYQEMSVAQLQEYCKNNNIKLPGNFNNKRYLVGAIERSIFGITDRDDRRRTSEQYKVVGITTKKEELDTKIIQRIEQMLAQGLVDEYQKVSKLYDKNSEVMRTNAYIVMEKYIAGAVDKKDLVKELVRSDKKLVKKQGTWFKRNEQIIWTELESADTIIEQIIS